MLALLVAGCSQNIEVVNSGERLEDSPKPKADPNATPLARPGAAAENKPEIPPFVKAYFMHMWVEALYGTPQNKHPNPKWSGAPTATGISRSISVRFRRCVTQWWPISRKTKTSWWG